MSRIVVLALAAVFAFGTVGDADAAARKKPRPKRTDSSLVQRDPHGTPIIMRDYRPSRTISIMKDEPGAGRVSDPPSRRAARSRGYARGSGGYVAPVLPSSSANSIPAPALVQPAPQVYRPPPITTFGDKVNNAIHDFPLQRGIGNNPNDLQSFIRQRANQ